MGITMAGRANRNRINAWSIATAVPSQIADVMDLGGVGIRASKPDSETRPLPRSAGVPNPNVMSGDKHGSEPNNWLGLAEPEDGEKARTE